MAKNPKYGININADGAFGNGLKMACAPVSVLSTGEKDTGLDFKAGDIILDAWARVKTKEDTGTTKTIDVGLLSSESGGDTDGFIDGLSTATAGTIVPDAAVTTGSNTAFMATNTYGVLLSDFQAGTDVDQDEGLFKRKKALIASATSLVYQLGSTHTELVADIYVLYFRPQENC